MGTEFTQFSSYFLFEVTLRAYIVTLLASMLAGVILIPLGKRTIQALRNRLTKQTTLIVKSPPGTVILKIASFIYSPQIVNKIIWPLIADMRAEYNDAIVAKASPVTLRIICLRHTLYIVKHLFSDFYEAGKNLVESIGKIVK